MSKLICSGKLSDIIYITYWINIGPNLAKTKAHLSNIREKIRY